MNWEMKAEFGTFISLGKILEYDVDLTVWVQTEIGSGTLCKGGNEREREIEMSGCWKSFMRQALAKQLFYCLLFVAKLVIQPWIQFARSVIVVYFEKNWEMGQWETAEDYCVTPVSWRSALDTAPQLIFASCSINTR